MSELEKLKRRLFKQEPSELDRIYNLCAVMEVCGGYEQLLNLPVAALNYILKYLEFLDKKAKKEMPRIRKPHK